MDLDKNLADHLAAWGRTRRGWDKAGCLSQLASVKGRSADDVAMAWVRFCADDGVRSPGAFPNLNGPHWSEKVAPPASPTPLKPSEACHGCGRPLHTPDEVCTPRAAVAELAPNLEVVRHLVDVTRQGLCSHGVPRTNCIDHREPKALAQGMSRIGHIPDTTPNPTGEPA